MSLRVWATWTWLLLAACGSDRGDDGDGDGDADADADGDADETCFLSVSMTGAVEQELDWGLRQGCGGSGGGVTTAGFGGITEEVSFLIRILSVSEGGTASGLRGNVRVMRDDETWWTPEESCTIDLTENVLVDENDIGRSYQLAGEGTCNAAAEADVATGATGTITVGPFAFRATALW